MFHNIVVKTLYTTKRSRPDTCTSLSFLTTRVRETNKYDWGDLFHIIKYIRGTRDIPFILRTNDSGVLKWWIDASYAVHPNMWVHTGGGIFMERVFTIMTSAKKKLNTRSSTESEVVGVHDCIPDV